MHYLYGITLSATKKRHSTEYVIWLLVLIGLLAKCVYFQFTTDISHTPFFSIGNVIMLISLIAVLATISGTILFIFNKRRILVLLVFHVIISLLLLSDTIYFRYFYNPITVQSIYQISLAGSISESIMSLLKPGDIIFAIDIPVLVIVLIKKRPDFKSREIKLKNIFRFLTASAFLAAGIAVSSYAYTKSSPGTFPFDNNYVVNNLGVLYFHYYDVKRYISENILDDRNLNADERSVLSSFFLSGGSRATKYNSAAKGMNLIIVQLEAIQNFVIGLEFNEKVVTPNLNKLIDESIYLENFYHQTGAGNTSDAEFLVNASLYPLKNGSVYFRYPNNTYFSLPKLLKKYGYTSYAFHANKPSFWNRTEMYRSMGFDHFISSNDFELDESLGWGLSDLSFFRQSLEKLGASKPFYAFLVTLTSHHPYTYFDNYNKFDAGAFEGTMAGNYAEAAHYVDMALGEFLNDLKSRGLYDNSLIIIYGDHNSVPRDQTEMLADLINFRFNEYNWTKLQRSPCFIICSGLTEKGINSTICGQLDLLPTIANLMGFESPPALGKDILNTEGGYAVLRNGSVITEDFIYTSVHGITYDKKGKILKSCSNDNIIKKYRHILEVSDIILRKNALDSFDQLQTLKK